MKIPLSYKNQYFGAMLGVSVLVHSSFLLVANIVSPSPKFAVQQAPSSMEVYIVKKTHTEKKPQQRIQNILTSEIKSKSEVSIKKEKPVERKVEKSIYIPPVKGADYTEAQPDYLKNPAPIYPEFAREQGWEGTVILNVLVNKQGIAAQISVEQSSGYKLLDQAAVKTVRNWKFLPTRVGQLSFDSWVKIPVRFLLTEQ